MKIFLMIMMMVFNLSAENKPTQEAAKSFAETFSNEVLTTLEVKDGDTSSVEDRMSKFRALLHKGIAMKSIGKASVGRFWDTGTEADHNQFHQLFEDFFVDVYAAHFKDYRVTNIKVVGVKDDEDGVWVITTVSQKDRPDITLEWKVVQGKEDLKIVNVVIDQFLNFSMNLNKAFVEIIANNGGEFSAILTELKNKSTLGKIAELNKK